MESEIKKLLDSPNCSVKGTLSKGSEFLTVAYKWIGKERF